MHQKTPQKTVRHAPVFGPLPRDTSGPSLLRCLREEGKNPGQHLEKALPPFSMRCSPPSTARPAAPLPLLWLIIGTPSGSPGGLPTNRKNSGAVRNGFGGKSEGHFGNHHSNGHLQDAALDINAAISGGGGGKRLCGGIFPPTHICQGQDK